MLQLTDDQIHISLSPTPRSPRPSGENDEAMMAASDEEDEENFVDIDLNTNSNTNSNAGGTSGVTGVNAGGIPPELKYEVMVRDVRSAPTRSASWYDGFLGCLKPVMSFMGKQKPSDNQNNSKGKCLSYFIREKGGLFLEISVCYTRKNRPTMTIPKNPWAV